MNVVVKTLSGQTAIITNASQTDYIKDLKTRILHSELHYPLALQKLEYKGVALDDSMRLCDYDYVAGDIIDIRMVLNSQAMLNHEENKQNQLFTKQVKNKNGKKGLYQHNYSYTNLNNKNDDKNNNNNTDSIGSVGCCCFM